MPDVILSAATGSRLSRVKLAELPGLVVIAASMTRHPFAFAASTLDRDLARCAIAASTLDRDLAHCAIAASTLDRDLVARCAITVPRSRLDR